MSLRRLGIRDVRKLRVARLDPHRADRRAGVRRRQKPGAVVIRAAVALRGADGHEARHALVLAAEAVGDPRPHDGRTNVSLPVWISSSAPPCREFDPHMDLMKQMSSTRLRNLREQTRLPTCRFARIA